MLCKWLAASTHVAWRRHAFGACSFHLLMPWAIHILTSKIKQAAMWCNIFYTTSQHYYSETDFAHISECCTAYRTYADRLTCWLVQHIQTPKHGWLEPPCQAKSLISEGCRDQTWISPCHLLRFRVIKYSLNQWQHGIVWNLCFKYCREGLVFKLHESVRAQTCKGSRQCKKNSLVSDSGHLWPT